jgi:arylsulfatase A-like enzyme
MSVKFTSGYVTAPLRGPSRAGFSTGRHQQRFGFVDNGGGIPTDPPRRPGVLHDTGSRAPQLFAGRYRMIYTIQKQ